MFLKENIITIDSIDESFDSFSIELDKYWSWVKRMDLNSFCENYYDPNAIDGHGQNCGYLTQEQYFNLNPSLIEDDLITYLEQKKNKPKI